MKYALALLGLAASAAAAPAGCSPSYSGQFTITPVNITSSSSKRSLMRRASPGSTLELTLNNGILMDNKGDTGYIASNYQFQFDNPPQAGAIESSGFSACSNGSLALGQTTVFFACIATDYYNFYTRAVRSGCSPIYFAINGGGSTGGQTTAVGGQTDGQPSATGVATVGALTDHQPTAITVATSNAVGALTDHQPTAVTVASTAAVGALTDHQPTAVTIASSNAIGALTDHQPTAVTIASSNAVGALTDHQPTASVIANATASMVPYTGAAAKIGNEFFAVAAGVVAAAML